MAYSEKVVEHFKNPRNVGTLDKDAKNVGTGIVGAPECFSGDTLIAVADGTHCQTLRTIYESKEIIPVWSFNIHTNNFEIQKAKAVSSG